MGAREHAADGERIASKVGKTVRNDGGSVRVTLYDALDLGWQPQTPVRMHYLDDGRIVIEAVGENPVVDGGEQE